jgi:hypothetical protein
MGKIWFFVEGDSEEYLLKALVQCLYPDLIFELDESEFILSNKTNISYCVNVGGVDNIPYTINEYISDEKIEKSRSNNLIIICDVEKLRCNTSRKEEIEKRLDKYSRKLNINYIFFNPMIEKLYWDCPELIKKVLILTYNKFYNSDSSLPEIRISEIRSSFKYKLKELFRKFNMKYRESRFSKDFFSNIDFHLCNNSEIARIVNIINVLHEKNKI